MKNFTGNRFRVFFRFTSFNVSGKEFTSFQDFTEFFKPKFHIFAKQFNFKFDFFMFATTGGWDGCFDFNFKGDVDTFSFFDKFSFFLHKEFAISHTETVQIKEFIEELTT